MGRWNEKRTAKELNDGEDIALEADDEWAIAIWGAAELGERRSRSLDGPMRPRKLEAIWARLRELCLAQSNSGRAYRLDDNALREASDSAWPRCNRVGNGQRGGDDGGGGSTLH